METRTWSWLWIGLVMLAAFSVADCGSELFEAPDKEMAGDEDDTGMSDEVSGSVSEVVNPDPLGGWHILQDDYDQDNLLDIISFEWDYYMVHDRKNGFYATIGYLVSNPRGRLSDIVPVLPDGGNLAFVGKLGGEEPIAHYINFGLEQYQASAEERSFAGESTKDDSFGRVTPLRGGGPDGVDALRIEGRTEAFEWNLVVSPEWGEREPQGEDRVVVGEDVGLLPWERWNVDPIWPRTRVHGSVVVRRTGEVLDVDAHGYRENAWGRYVITTDGWDFYVFSEDRDDLLTEGIDPSRGVSLVLQTYHASTTLDFAKVSFYDGEALQSLTFTAKDKQVAWSHPHWQWDNESWQCVPLDLKMRLENDDYLVEATVSMGMSDQRPLLSDLTLAVAVYFIQELYPYYEGTIRNKKTGELVRGFRGLGGGEFSLAKAVRLWPASKSECTRWGSKTFAFGER